MLVSQDTLVPFRRPFRVMMIFGSGDERWSLLASENADKV